MMKLFHTTDRIIKSPDIHAGRTNADFGPGFYMSTDEEFAGNWARERKGSDIFVNIYELDTEGLSKKTLQRDTEWFGIIYDNRTGRGDGLLDYDVVIGPVANDTLFETYGIATSGQLTDELAVAIMSIGAKYEQVVIKTDRALAKLRWIDAYTISEEQMEHARAKYVVESEQFDKVFAGLLDDGEE